MNLGKLWMNPVRRAGLQMFRRDYGPYTCEICGTVGTKHCESQVVCGSHACQREKRRLRNTAKLGRKKTGA